MAGASWALLEFPCGGAYTQSRLVAWSSIGRATRRRAARWLLLHGLVLGAGTLTTLVLTTPAHAQDKEALEKARRLYRQGISKEAAGDWAGALAKFEEVAKVKLTPQVRFHMGRCKENLGRLTEALGDYRVAEYEAEQAGAKELDEIRGAREKLEGRVPKLVIVRGKGAENAKIELDGVEVGDSQVGKEVSVDPGPHRVVAKLPNGQSFEESVNVSEGQTEQLELVAPKDLGVAAALAEPEEEEGPPPDDGADAREDEGSGALPWVIGGIGAVSLVASGVFFTMKNSAEDDLDKECRGDICPKSLQSKQDDGEMFATLTTVTLGVGVVGIGVAAVMLLTSGGAPDDAAKEASRDPKRLRVHVGTSSRFMGVNLGGSF